MNSLPFYLLRHAIAIALLLLGLAAVLLYSKDFGNLLAERILNN